MDIRFEFQDVNKGDPIKINELKELDGDAKIIVDKVYSFVKQRLKPLEDLMNQEKDGYVAVNIRKPEIRYYYSEELANKMMGSITEEDFRHEMTKIYLSINQQ